MAAPTWLCGFETGALRAEPAPSSAALPVVTGAATIETVTVRTGTYSLKLVPASGAAGNLDFSIATTWMIRFYARVTVLPASTRGFFGTVLATRANIRITSTGALEVRENTTVLGTSTTKLADSTLWYLIELDADGTNVKLRINGTQEVSALGASGGMQILFGAPDTVAATYTAYIDDCALYAAGTATQPGSVACLVATSLNTANGWVEGDGAGTANMSAAVSTRPPPGLASANETNATNIESPTNSATDNCDMNMTTYTAAGIGASDTINGIMGFARHGEDIATGTKAGAVVMVSNPASAFGETAFNYGNDQGLHGAEVNFWWTTIESVTTTTAVTLGTAPVLRVGKRTATTRVVCVDFMGIYVDYTPRRAPPFSRRHRNYIIR